MIYIVSHFHQVQGERFNTSEWNEISQKLAERLKLVSSIILQFV